MKRSTSLALGALLAAALSLASACSGTFDLQIETTPAAEATITALETEKSRLATEVAHQESRLGRLAYVQGSDVWVKTLPDGEPRRLTDDGRNSQPRWSPSGEWLAFHKGKYQTWVIRSDGTNARPLNDGAAVDVFAWSPVDDRLAYVAGDELRTVDADGAGSAPVLSGAEGDPLTPPPEGGRRIGQIAWGPDGQWIAYEQRKQSPGGPPETSVWKVSAEGGEPDALYLPIRSEIRGPLLVGWTGDGRFLLLQDDMNSASLLADGSPLYALPAGGGSLVPLAQPVLAHADFVLPAPSSDRVAVVVGGFRGTWENKALHVIQPSSPEGQSLTPPEQAVSSPAWSPDGRRIACVAMPDQAGEDVAGGEPAHRALMQRRIWLMEADGSGGRPLTDDSTCRDERPLWSADGSHILFARLDAEDRASLWLTSVEGGDRQQIVEELTPAPEWFGYYGHIEWDQWFDWWHGSAERSQASDASMLPANPTPPPANWTPTPPSEREQADDLDDDGADEWLIGVPEPDRRCAIPWRFQQSVSRCCLALA